MAPTLYEVSSGGSIDTRAMNFYKFCVRFFFFSITQMRKQLVKVLNYCMIDYKRICLYNFYLKVQRATRFQNDVTASIRKYFTRKMLTNIRATSKGCKYFEC